MTWVTRLQRFSPLGAIVAEIVAFDIQRLMNPQISGNGYRQGTLFGYELREYLLHKWGRRCAYCGAQQVPLEIDHIISKRNGGSSRISNLTLACGPCNQRKSNTTVQAFLARDPIRLARLFAYTTAPLKDAAAMNAIKWTLWRTLQATGLPVRMATGGRTKWNRTRLGIQKSHALDALCTDHVNSISDTVPPTLTLVATGRGTYSRTNLTAHGFPRSYLTCHKRVHGFQTGDHVSLVLARGKCKGSHRGRVAVRANGSFTVRTTTRLIQGVSYKRCRLLQRADGYAYRRSPLPLLWAKPTSQAEANQ